ncbi:MAG: 4-hydroxy-tetrahydrodipicolinate synthase, partial [Gammaproteobacteria bacterium]|nr:4-hydroxy-tetrahydrodipicolinate synthase [Gammaproteobacteria bacterium]
PTPTKWALSNLGRIKAGIRLPLIPLSGQYHELVRERIAAAGAHA